MFNLFVVLLLSVTASTQAAKFPSTNAEKNLDISLLSTLIVASEDGFDESAAEILAYDPISERIVFTNGELGELGVIDFSKPSKPVVETTIALPGGPNSVAVCDGIAAVAVDNVLEVEEDNEFQLNGAVVFIDLYDLSILATITAGSLPDNVVYTPDCSYVLTANEGEPNEAYTFDPEGSITIIDTKTYQPVTLGFSAFNKFEDELIAAGVRIFGPGATVAQDLEPEFIAVAPDGKTAVVSCQENNAFAVVDIINFEIVAVVPLGFKDHSKKRNSLDASNEDGEINITTWPVFGMYQPDTIASYVAGDGKTYLVSANEGDGRDYDGFSEEERVADVVLDPKAFPDAEFLQKEENLGRLRITTAMGDIDGDGDFDVLFSYGGRSFAIWDEDLKLVFDSGSWLELITADLFPENFNSDNDENTFDSRSDDAGPEPEGVVIFQMGDVSYAAILLERISGVAIFDITDPYAPRFEQYVNNRDFSVDVDDDPFAAGDLGPEGGIFIAAEDSPTGEALLVIANEVSGTITTYTVSTAAPPKKKGKSSGYRNRA